jgi:hypothetical protein
VPGLKGTIGEELLKEHISYGLLVQKLLKKFNGRDGVSPSRKFGSPARRPSQLTTGS